MTYKDFAMRWDLPEEDNILTEEQLCEMARVSRKESGINVVIFASRSEYVSGRHWARIKVSNVPRTFSKSDNFSVSITDNPGVISGKSKLKNSELESVIDWVKLNKKVLLDYWNNVYESDADFLADLIKV